MISVRWLNAVGAAVFLVAGLAQTGSVQARSSFLDRLNIGDLGEIVSEVRKRIKRSENSDDGSASDGGEASDSANASDSSSSVENPKASQSSQTSGMAKNSETSKSGASSGDDEAVRPKKKKIDRAELRRIFRRYLSRN